MRTKYRDYRIKLTARNEGLEYVDESNVYRFNVNLKGEVWTVFLPGSRGEKFEIHELEKVEEEKILPRLSKFLSCIKWFGLFPHSYSVKFVRSDET